jgi:hypothetical protein
LSKEPIADHHHIVRHCQPNALRPEDGSPSPAAFIDDDRDGISCNWLEYFSGDQSSRIVQVREAIAAQRTLRKSHKLAILNVGAARSRALESLRQRIFIVKDPLPELNGKPPDPSHALIEQVADTFQVALGEALAESVLQSVPGKI